MSSKIFNDSVTAPLITDSVAGQANLRGMLFNVSTQEVSLTAGQSILIVATDGLTSGVVVAGDLLITSSLQGLDVEIYLNPTFTGGSTSALTPRCLNTAFPDSGAKMTANLTSGSITITGGTLLLSRLVPSSSDGVFPVGGRLIITPGTTVGVRAAPKGTGSQSAEMSFSWAEFTFLSGYATNLPAP